MNHGNVKFIRKNGKIIPIKVKYSKDSIIEAGQMSVMEKIIKNPPKEPSQFKIDEKTLIMLGKKRLGIK